VSGQGQEAGHLARDETWGEPLNEAGRSVGDALFFARTGPHPLSVVSAAAIAGAAGADVRGECGPLHGVAPLQSAGPQQISFIDNRRYLDALAATHAGAVIVHPDLADRVPAGTVAIVTPEPYPGWARVAALFHPPTPTRPGIHRSAVVEDGALIDPSAEIGANAVIGAGAVIGPRTRIGPGAVIADNVQIGPDCRIGALSSITHSILGARVNILPGARIGQEGFGFATTAAGFLTVPQLGRVILEDDVEVGANSTIDRGSAQDTVIGAGTRLDNLVMIGHNVRTGRCCVVVAHAGISGSTILGDFVVVAAQAGLTGHLRIGAKARIGAQAGVMGDVPAGADVVGSPAEPVRDFFRGVATLRKLARRPTVRPTAPMPASPANDRPPAGGTE
jgi:UDP-3-O-[3-hydroxymyristoyl] glucosamine N-acyltransferase